MEPWKAVARVVRATAPADCRRRPPPTGTRSRPAACATRCASMAAPSRTFGAPPDDRSRSQPGEITSSSASGRSLAQSNARWKGHLERSSQRHKPLRALQVDLPVYPILRPRGGNFVYTDSEFDLLCDRPSHRSGLDGSRHGSASARLHSRRCTTRCGPRLHPAQRDTPASSRREARIEYAFLARFRRSVIAKPRLLLCSAPFPSSVTTTDVSPLTPLQNVLQSLPTSCPLSPAETPPQPG